MRKWFQERKTVFAGIIFWRVAQRHKCGITLGQPVTPMGFEIIFYAALPRLPMEQTTRNKIRSEERRRQMRVEISRHRKMLPPSAKLFLMTNHFFSNHFAGEISCK